MLGKRFEQRHTLAPILENEAASRQIAQNVIHHLARSADLAGDFQLGEVPR